MDACAVAIVLRLGHAIYNCIFKSHTASTTACDAVATSGDLGVPGRALAVSTSPPPLLQYPLHACRCVMMFTEGCAPRLFDLLDQTTLH